LLTLAWNADGFLLDKMENFELILDNWKQDVLEDIKITY
jgi:hypothetical protein